MTKATGDSASAADADAFLRDWRAVRGDGEIQFEPVPLPKPPELPGWWKEFTEFLGWLFRPIARLFGAIGEALGFSLPVLLWGLGAIAAVLVGLIVWRYAAAAAARRRPAEAEARWALEAGDALALLEEADRLAGEGRFDEAAHLLLKRSVGQIAAARPGLLDPSTTAREIAALPVLSEAARAAFGAIAGLVERSLFALRRLDADDWRTARAAYADFALAVPAA